MTEAALHQVGATRQNSVSNASFQRCWAAGFRDQGRRCQGKSQKTQHRSFLQQKLTANTPCNNQYTRGADANKSPLSVNPQLLINHSKAQMTIKCKHVIIWFAQISRFSSLLSPTFILKLPPVKIQPKSNRMLAVFTQLPPSTSQPSISLMKLLTTEVVLQRNTSATTAAIQIQGLNSPRPRAGSLGPDGVDSGMLCPDPPSGRKDSLPEPWELCGWGASLTPLWELPRLTPVASSRVTLQDRQFWGQFSGKD